ncbi:hypothetical protein EYF88_15355 [Paracoccus sediminis]|uniref:Sulfotransferase family protein n=1 Tax=Paracoccus sediminis TaxID=1214787 RepID=A0A238Y2W7_9RHOB|nr:hypothetical protein [Paracoccus sediminis]TBN47207.1 hypothetical protein EYF88_15355 [Paracoccus sediminis]SNR65121.1 hypothetical protein SAMN06265378_11420 [Paracoccus sediminis]
MQMVFHLGVHGTDGDRLLKTLLNNRDVLMRQGTDIITPNRHRGLFEEALMALKGGQATPEMQQIMLDAVLHGDAPNRAVFSTPTFMGAPGRAVGQAGLYPQMGARAAALANLFPDHTAEFFLAIRNPASLIAEVLPIFTGGGYHVLMQGRHPLDLRWRDPIQALLRAVPGRRVVIWCHEDVPLIWPEIVRLAGNIPPDAPLHGGMMYLEEILTDTGMAQLKESLSMQDRLTVAQRRALSSHAIRDHAVPDALDQSVDLPGWTQEMVDRMTDQYHADVSEIAVLPGVEFVLV